MPIHSRWRKGVVAGLLLFVALVGVSVRADELRDQVEARERAFATSMRERNFAAFSECVSSEAIFFSAQGALRGKEAVLAAWKGFFAGESAPFSWEPDLCEVLASGDLALTSGPVYNPKGELVARFNSIWRREADGVWRVVFDRGEPASPPKR